MTEELKIVLGVTASVAAIKTASIIECLKSKINNCQVAVIPTERALHFLPPNLHELHADKIHLDEEEWKSWQARGDPVLHIELRKWADVLIIAPLDANTLAKLANGLADNLLTCVARAWDFSKPCFFAPAMNTFMWEHPVTSGQVEQLTKWGYIEIPCIEKILMCNDKGKGAMAEPQSIADVVCHHLTST